MSARLRKIIREQREEIRQLKERIEDLENIDHSCSGDDFEGMGMMISGAMKEDLAREAEEMKALGLAW